MAGKIKPMGVTFGPLSVLEPAAVTDFAQSAQTLGYQSIWTAEATAADAMTLLSAAGQAAPGMGLATGIVPVQLRTPSLNAMTAATLQALNPDSDILLGVGVSAPVILRAHGIDMTNKPIGLMREYVSLLRECLSGEPVTFEGDYFSVKRFQLGVQLGERKPRIIMAALNPKMLKLAGELADGVLLNYIPASHVATSIDHVRQGGDATIYANVHAVVGKLEEQIKSARLDLFIYAMADGYSRMFRQAGFESEVDEVRAKYAAKDRDGAVAAISERMVQAINFIGSESEVTEFVKAYVDAGVEYPVLMPMPWGDDRRAVTDATMKGGIAAVS